jgi:hypothetical protein
LGSNESIGSSVKPWYVIGDDASREDVSVSVRERNFRRLQESTMAGRVHHKRTTQDTWCDEEEKQLRCGR